MATIYEYINSFNKAIQNYTAILSSVLIAFKNNNEKDKDLTSINYDDIIMNFEQIISYFQQNKVKYKYDKLSKEEFDLVLQSLSENNGNGYITISKEYQIKDIDTLQSICTENNINIDKLLSFNQMSLDDFDNAKELNQSILIPKKINLNERNTIQNLPVYGSINGKKAWGSDISNEVSMKNNDLKILSNQDTLVQHIINKFGAYDTIPGYEGFTIDISVGNGYDRDLESLLNIVKIKESLLADARIKEVQDIKFDNLANGVILYIDLVPINTNKTTNVKIEFISI